MNGERKLIAFIGKASSKSRRSSPLQRGSTEHLRLTRAAKALGKPLGWREHLGTSKCTTGFASASV